MPQPERILIIGPESTGKSTLASDLAGHFRTRWVPEFAREYLMNLSRDYTYSDLLKIAKGQMLLEDEQAAETEGFLICDTDLRVIKVWSEHKFGKVDPWILEEIEKRVYSLILVTDIDLPWEFDSLREHPDPEMRAYFLNKYLDLTEESGLPYRLVSGDRQERIEKSVSFITEFLPFSQG